MAGRRPGTLCIDRRVLAWVALLGTLVLVLFGAAVLLGQHPALDREATELAVDTETSVAVWLASEPFEEIADPTFVTPFAIGVAIGLAAMRWWAALLTLALAFPVFSFGGTELKELFDRDRPAVEIGASGNQAYPSGHSRFSVFWLFLAVTIAAYLPMSRARRRAVVAAGAAAMVVAGLSRIYIRAHWVTDVLGGWAMSLAAYSAAGLLVVTALSRAGPALHSGLPPRRA